MMEKIFLSTCYGIYIEPPYLAEMRQRRETIRLQYEMNKESDFPSWMTLEEYLAIQEFKRQNIKRERKSIFKRFINWFK